MDFGAHLPLMDFGGNPYSLDALTEYTDVARQLGFTALCVNDHMVFEVPWLDGPTALASVLAHSGDMSLVTTVALPVVRGPVPLAKALGAIARLSGGRLIAGVGPGSSKRDYDAIGLDFAERWQRLDEAIQALRAMWTASSPPFVGRFYSTDGLELRPPPADCPPIWLGSWGSDAGLRRTARLADGWLASAYNTVPRRFAEARHRLGEMLVEEGRDPVGFPNGLATMFFHIARDREEAEAVLRERIFPTIKRPEEVLRDRLPIGDAEGFAEKLEAFREAGVQRVFIWPVTDEIRQLTLFRENVLPLLG